jgi:hypothetical protein
LRRLPQPSSMVPQTAPACMQVRGWHPQPRPEQQSL